MSEMVKKLVVLAVVFAVALTASASDTIYSCNFEAFEGFDASGPHGQWPGDGGTSVDGQNGWTFDGTYWAKVQTPVENGWSGRTGNQFLAVNTAQDAAYTPSFDTSAYQFVKVSFDVRPSDLANDGYWGAYIDLLGSDVINDTNPTISRIMLLGEVMGASKGHFTAYNGIEADTMGNAGYDPNYAWEFETIDTTYHIEILLDQTARAYSLKVNGVQTQEGNFMSWLDPATYGGSIGTLAKIKFNGGNLYAYRTLYDNIKIEGYNPVYSSNFEMSEGFTNGDDSTSIAGQNGWTVAGWAGDAAVMKVLSWPENQSGDQQILGVYWGAQAFTPQFDTSSFDKVKIEFDLRPSDAGDLSYGAIVELRDAAGNPITLLKLEGQVTNGDSYKIKAFRSWTGYSDDGSMYDTGISWSFDTWETYYHFEVTLDQIAKTWTLNVNGQQPPTATNQPWLAAGLIGVPSIDSLAQIKVQAGQSNEVLTIADNINVFGYTTCDSLVESGLILDGDINGDCKVNIEDFTVMAQNWLVDMLQ